MLIPHGYLVLPHLLNVSEVALFRDTILTNRPRVRWYEGFAIPDVLGQPEYGLFKHLCFALWENLQRRAPWVAQRGLEIIDMCDIQINRTAPWHRDVLRGPSRRFQTHDLWTSYDDHAYNMYRLIVYLQDHTTDGIRVSPMTHASRGPNRTHMHYRESPFRGTHSVTGAAGQGVLFDMRLVHAGRHIPTRPTRVSMQLTVGLRNVFAENWARGDKVRRDTQVQRAIFPPT